MQKFSGSFNSLLFVDMYRRKKQTAFVIKSTFFWHLFFAFFFTKLIDTNYSHTSHEFQQKQFFYEK